MHDKHPSRRSVLAMLSAAPVVAGTALAAPGIAEAATGRSPSSGSVPDGLRPGGAFDDLVARLAAEDRFSGTVLLEHRDRPVLERAYGMADHARGIPNESGTIFSTASVTKLFTSIAIAQLAEQGALHHHDTVGRHLDGFAPEVADAVTVHQLLTHTSGLGNYMRIGDFWREAATWDSVEEAWEGTLRYVRMDRPTLVPGSGSVYSNTGFVILGAIVARLSDMTYYDYIRTRVFAASRTTATDFYTLPRWRADRRIAHPYVKDGDEITDVIDDRQTFVGTPAGGAFATAADLARIVKTLLRGDLVGEQHLYLAMSPKTPRDPGADPAAAAEPPPPASFGNYLTISALTGGQWVLGHGGGAPGISANVHWFPDSDWFVAVLANCDDAAGEVVNAAVRHITE
ncbi:serine hydrolase domain-containing protein [Allonocardiopsis opalescens]|uniref:CubicO group peptidase (Beta-lactamase class C family) n=1 Tax=Allonocardiopsis opalescens TaxID=1144618 RepID=A0A2T0QF03_9ACTN|nr:serine hydrolase domain-containing protein [Allonocardiopsis opalescens]PRY02498.1 CubicO group peptidase (beta-lactamase class C family) [Allonocardiopsis opalescens]